MANPAALLIDLDGVLYEGDRIVEGAAACVRWLVERPLKFHAFFNNLLT